MEVLATSELYMIVKDKCHFELKLHQDQMDLIQGQLVIAMNDFFLRMRA